MGRVTTADIPTWFREQMTRMIGLKFAPPDMTTHWEALQDMPEPLLAAAVTRAQQHTTEFPSPKMLRIYADQVRSRVIPVPQEEDRSIENPTPVEAKLPTGQVIPLKRYWRYYCDDCSDSGWVSIWCGSPERAKPWQVVGGDCGRSVEHAPHEFVKPCPCASTNPDIQRRIERSRQGAKSGSERE